MESTLCRRQGDISDNPSVLIREEQWFLVRGLPENGYHRGHPVDSFPSSPTSDPLSRRYGATATATPWSLAEMERVMALPSSAHDVCYRIIHVRDVSLVAFAALVMDSHYLREQCWRRIQFAAGGM